MWSWPALRWPCTLLTNNHRGCRCGMVLRLHPWNPSCTAATLPLCWNSAHNLDCYRLRHVLHLKCSIVILILCGRNMVCNSWGCYREIGGREGTDVEQACRVGLKPVGRSSDVSYISCKVMWNSFYLSTVDITGGKKSERKANAVPTAKQHLWDMWHPHEEKWDCKGETQGHVLLVRPVGVGEEVAALRVSALHLSSERVEVWPEENQDKEQCCSRYQ